MLSIFEIDKREINVCFALDSTTLSLWSKEQWSSEFEKKGVKVMGLSLSSKIIGVCVFQEVLDEAQINYFSIDFKFRRKGYGSFFMNYLISQYKIKNFKKLLLEVSEANLIANKFYTKLEFLTVGRRKNYYKDGSDAVLKEKKLIK